MAWNTISAAVLDQVFGYQGFNRFRENLIALAACRFTCHLGGSRQTTLPLVASAQDAIDWIDFEVNGDNLGGLTKQLRAEVRAGASTGVTPSLYNTTTAAAAGTGVSCTATNADYSGSNQKQTVTVTLASGANKYRLQATPANTTDGTYAIGYVEIFA